MNVFVPWLCFKINLSYILMFELHVMIYISLRLKFRAYVGQTIGLIKILLELYLVHSQGSVNMYSRSKFNFTSMRHHHHWKNYDSWYFFFFREFDDDITGPNENTETSPKVCVCWSVALHQVVSLVKQSSISQHLRPDPSKANGQNFFLNCRKFFCNIL